MSQLTKYIWGHQAVFHKMLPLYLIHRWPNELRKYSEWRLSWKYFDGLDERYHHEKFGEMLRRTPIVGAKMWCLFFVFCFFCYAPNPYRSFEGCIVWTSIALPLIGRFRGGFQRFWQGITLPDALHSSHFHRCLASQFSPNCGQKLRKVRKSAGKFCAQLSKDSWEIWRKFHRSSLGPRM